MDEEEPAWRAELREAIHRWDPYETEAPLRMKGGLLDTVLPHIEAAEARGRRQALDAVAGQLEEVPPIDYALGTFDPVAHVRRLATEAGA